MYLHILKFNMLTKQQLGYLFEDCVHELISHSNFQVLREKEIVEKYSNLSYGIDHLIYLQDFIICIQDKWRDIKSSLSDINHFIKCVENIHVKENNKKCIGIYLSKIVITKGGVDAFEFENRKNCYYFLSLYDDNIKMLLNKLTKFLYDMTNVYLYELDGSAIMTYDVI